MIYGKGYLGIGSYTKDDIQFRYWKHMLERCYSKTYTDKNTTYKECIVCEEWLCYQNFAKWFYENYYSIKGQAMDLDKDILYKDNKVYSPQTCIFVPHRINALFIKSNATRGDYPIGVSLKKSTGKFESRCRIFECGKSKIKHIGYFNTPKEAFYDGYKIFKEQYIKQVAEENKDEIPYDLYEAMYNYVVDIND